MSFPHFSFRFLPITSSTNAVLKNQVQSGEMLFGALAAGEQTAGRGRGENTWISPFGGVYVSVAAPIDDPTRLYLKGPHIAVEVVRWLKARFSLDARIKWPNDFLVADRKLGGMLLELVRSPQGMLVVVAGIGMNVHVTPMIPTRRMFLPTSLSEWVDVSCVSVETLAQKVAQLAFDALIGSPNPVEILDFHRRYSATLGRRVQVALPGGQQVIGQAVDFTSDFRLCVETEFGVLNVQAGDCWHEPTDCMRINV